jgi:hypothetical protein
MVKIFDKKIFFKFRIVAIDRIINNLDREIKTKQKELEQLKVCFKKIFFQIKKKETFFIEF